MAGYFDAIKTQIAQFFSTQFKPFLTEHPIIGITLLFSVGFITTIFLFATVLLIIKKMIKFLALGSAVALPGGRHQLHTEEIWSFDPHKRPSEDQLKITQKNLEKLVQRAPVLGGHVPKSADSSLRELAKRNRDSEFNYRNAIYVMGPIKGTKFDNQYELPIALDQVKKIGTMMKQSAVYETLPLDLVILRAKKGSNNWEVEPSIAPVNLGKSFPAEGHRKSDDSISKFFHLGPTGDETQNRLWDSLIHVFSVGHFHLNSIGKWPFKHRRLALQNGKNLKSIRASNRRSKSKTLGNLHRIGFPKQRLSSIGVRLPKE